MQAFGMPQWAACCTCAAATGRQCAPTSADSHPPPCEACWTAAGSMAGPLLTALLFLNACIEVTRSPADGSWHQQTCSEHSVPQARFTSTALSGAEAPSLPCRSAEVRQQLLRLAICLLYPSPAAASAAHLAAYPDDLLPGGQSFWQCPISCLLNPSTDCALPMLQTWRGRSQGWTFLLQLSATKLELVLQEMQSQGLGLPAMQSPTCCPWTMRRWMAWAG